MGSDAGWSGGPLLALETATRQARVALLDGDGCVERALPEGVRTAESLLPVIDGLLGEAGVPLADVRAFAVSIGPGSFTGLRIGVATAKGLAFGSDARLAAVPTLAGLALAAGGEGPRVALLDAQRGEVYAAGYDRPGDLVPGFLPEGLYRGDELTVPEACRLVGEGVRVLDREGDDLAPSAAAVARLAVRQLAAGEGVAAAALAPRYVRRAEAEARRLGEATEEPSGRP